jgi:hypothetical protein
MSRLVVPLDHQILWSTGDVVLRAELDLLLRDGSGNWHREVFRVDSASDMTTFPAHRAWQLNLPIPLNPSAVTHEQTGLDVRSGQLRCRIVGMDQTEYVFPCYFLGEPSIPPDPNAPPGRVPRNLLGLSGVVDKVRLSFDGTPAPPHALYGNLLVEKL